MKPEETLFNSFGRLIPKEGEIVYSHESRRYFSLSQPEINYQEIHQNIEKYLGPSSLTAQAFQEQALNVLEKIKNDPKISHILNGVHVPFLYPKIIEQLDPGSELEQNLLPAIKNSFSSKFPEYRFTNYCDGKLKGKVGIIPNVGYERLLNKVSEQTVVGWYFPNTLSEYSIPDQRKLMVRIQNDFFLSGALEAACAFIGTPEILLKKDNVYPPLLCLSAMSAEQEKFFYFFEAYGWNLTFNTRSYIGAVSEYFAGGLSVI